MYSGPILITGCSRGLGLEMVKQLSQSGGGAKRVVILATCRSPEKAGELQEVAKMRPDIVVVKKLDVTAYQTFPTFLEEIKPYTEGSGLGLLINNAGVSPGLTRLTQVQPQQMAETYNSNVIAPLMLTKLVLPLLKQAAKTNEKTKKPLVVNMSSILSSIARNSGKVGGGIYPYRTSKCALNMVTRSLSLDLAGNGIGAISVHPGWVRTDLGGPNAPLDVVQSVAGIIQLLEGFRDEVHNGNFFDYEGNPLEW